MRRYVTMGIVSVVVMAGLIAAWSQAREKLDDRAKAGEKAPDRDAKLLEGEWVVVSGEDDGVKAPANDVQGNKWLFKGSVITAFVPDGTTGKLSFKVDPGKKPKEIDVTPLDGPFKGKVQVGIYELDEGHLRVCLRDLMVKKGRPTEFATTEGSGLTMITFEKKR